MDDTTDVSEVDQSEEHEYVFEDHDLMLELLVALVNGSPGTEIGVTLNVPGGFVTGLLIDAKDWCHQAAEASGNESAAAIYNTWAQEIDDYDTDDNPVPPGHVHLRNAFIFSGGKAIPSGSAGFFWRGRLTQISGWTMGNLTSEG